jgi:hypothetical protein
MYEKIILAIGGSEKVKKGLFGSFNIIYCGMPSENIFSIGLKESYGNQGFAMNLFFPKNCRTIKVRDTEFTVFDVTPETLTLERVMRRPR